MLDLIKRKAWFMIGLNGVIKLVVKIIYRRFKRA